MKRKAILATTALLAIAVAPAEEGKTGDAPAFDPAVFAELTAPGEDHKELAKFAGTWTMAQTFFMPGAPPMKFTGTTVSKLAIGGRYLISEVTSDFMGSYSGMGIDAYDKTRKQYVNTWIDSMGTGIMVSYGLKKNDGSFEFTSEPQRDPMSGKEVIFRMVNKFDSDDQMTLNMFTRTAGSGADEEQKIMTIVYTRK